MRWLKANYLINHWSPTSELLISHILSRILIVSVVPEEDDEDYEDEDDDKQEGDDNRNHAWACLFNFKSLLPNFFSLLIWFFRASWSCFFDLRVIWFDEIRLGFLSIEISSGLSKINVSSGFCFLDAQKVFLYADGSPCRRCFSDTTTMFFLEDVNVRFSR